MDPRDLGKQLRRLRARSGVGLRELSARAELSAAALSAIERGQSSPTLATLHRILVALKTDFADFFALPADLGNEMVFLAGEMSTISDKYRKYTMLFPKRKDIRFEILQETIAAQERQPEWEKHTFDMGCLVIAGGPLLLEIDGQPSWRLRKGDAFYIKANARHRAINQGKTPVRLVTVLYPPRY